MKEDLCLAEIIAKIKGTKTILKFSDVDHLPIILKSEMLDFPLFIAFSGYFTVNQHTVLYVQLFTVNCCK